MGVSPLHAAPLRLGLSRPGPHRAMRPPAVGSIRGEPATPAALREATPRADIAEIPARSVVTLDAGGPDLQPSLGILREVMRRLRLSRRQRGAAPIPSAPLERRCWFEPAAGALPGPGRARWSLRLAVPGDLSEQELRDALAPHLSSGHQLPPAAAGVRLEHLAPAVVGRVLHLGPLDDRAVTASLALIRRVLEGARIEPTVVRVALENAVSVAGTLLLTEATMTDMPEAKPAAAAAPSAFE